MKSREDMTLEEFYSQPMVTELKADFAAAHALWLKADDVDLLDIEEPDGEVVKRTEKQEHKRWMDHFLICMGFSGWNTIEQIKTWRKAIEENGYKDLLEK